jgi:hypothetical protein
MVPSLCSVADPRKMFSPSFFFHLGYRIQNQQQKRGGKKLNQLSYFFEAISFTKFKIISFFRQVKDTKNLFLTLKVFSALLEMLAGARIWKTYPRFRGQTSIC